MWGLQQHKVKYTQRNDLQVLFCPLRSLYCISIAVFICHTSWKRRFEVVDDILLISVCKHIFWLLFCPLVFIGLWKRTKRRRYSNDSGRTLLMLQCFVLGFFAICQPWCQIICQSTTSAVWPYYCVIIKWKPGGNIVWSKFNQWLSTHPHVSSQTTVLFQYTVLCWVTAHKNKCSHRKNNWCSSFMTNWRATSESSHSFLFSSSTLGMLDAALFRATSF